MRQRCPWFGVSVEDLPRRWRVDLSQEIEEGLELDVLPMGGEMIDGVIAGMISRSDKPKFDVEYRLTRRIDIPTS